MPRPWITLALCLSLGVCLAPPTAIAATVAGLALLLARRPGVALPIAAVAAGAWAGGATARWTAAQPPRPPAPLTGTVTDVRLVGERVAVQVAPDDQPAWQVVVWQGFRPRGLASGARVRVRGPLTPLPPADNPGNLDAAAYAAGAWVAWRGRGPVTLLAAAPARAEATVAARVQARRRLAHLAHPFGGAVLTGLLLGDRAAVPPAAVEALAATGAGHLLAVSGLHVGGLAAVLFALCWRISRRLGAIRPDRWAAWLALPAVPAFVLLAQAPLSARRAGWMVAGLLVARAWGRRPAGIELLGLAALVVLADRPQAVTEPGFQLSFGAVGALLLAPSGGGRLRQALIATTVAWLATAPIQAWHFGTAAPLAPLANLVLTPLAATLVVPLGLLGLLLSGWTTAPLEVAAVAAEALVALAEGFATWADLQIVGAHAAPALAAPIVAAGLWSAGLPRLARWGPVGLALWSAWLWPAGVTVDFVAVGQGDATVVRAGGQTLLVDAGPDRAARALLGYLRHEGVRRIDTVVLSHRHPDHYGGLVGVAAALPIGEVIDHGVPDAGGPWGRLAGELVRHGVPVRRPPPGGWRLGDAHVAVLAADPPAGLAENDRSLVLRVAGPAGSVLLTGDVEGPGEARLAGRVPPSTVLKAPHHGSNTSSGPRLLADACPAAVVFPVGRHNRYGFPHPAVLARYAARAIPGWRTDLDGRVRVRLHDAAPTIEAMRRARQPLAPRGCAPAEAVP